VTRSKAIALLLLGLGVIAFAVTIGNRSLHWHGVCEANRDKFSDDPCAAHALLGALSETRPFSWLLKVTPSARSLELIKASGRHDALIAAGRHADALPFAMEALWLHIRIFGPEHPNNAIMLDNLATIRRARGEDEEAASIEARAAAIRAQ